MDDKTSVMRTCATMNRFRIELARDQALLDRILAVRRAVFVVERGVSEKIERDGFDVLGGGCDHFLIVCNGQDAGAFRCMRASEAEVVLQRFCVQKTYRELGAGKQALAQMESYYARRGITRVRLDAKFEAAGFYEACGYPTTSEPFMEAGIPHVKMEKKL